MSQRAVVVTGTDTGVGKTLVAAALLIAGARRGWRTAGLKPVAAGCAWRDGRLENADALALQRAGTGDLDYRVVNPVALEPAIAPHIAARRVGLTLTVRELARHCEDVRQRELDLVVVEGAGGWLVPLNDTETLADLCRELAMPVVLVIGMKLGCLSHALLTARAIQAEGLELAGWVANVVDAEMDALDDNLTTLQQRLPGPCLGTIPYQGADPNAAAVADLLNLAELFQ